jgi:hypothetical protein
MADFALSCRTRLDSLPDTAAEHQLQTNARLVQSITRPQSRTRAHREASNVPQALGGRSDVRSDRLEAIAPQNFQKELAIQGGDTHNKEPYGLFRHRCRAHALVSECAVGGFPRSLGMKLCRFREAERVRA